MAGLAHYHSKAMTTAGIIIVAGLVVAGLIWLWSGDRGKKSSNELYAEILERGLKQTDRLEELHKCIELLQKQLNTQCAEIRKLQEDTSRNATGVRKAHDWLTLLGRDVRPLVKAWRMEHLN